MAKLRHLFDHMYMGPVIMATETWDGSVTATPDAKVLNIGTTANRLDFTTSGNVVNLRASFNHSSGDARAMYSRLYLEGSVGGDCHRIFTSVNSNVDTARGAHISLNFEATAGGSECSGVGTPLNCTLHIPNIASWAPTGSLYGALIEIYSDGANSDPAGLTNLSFLTISNSGNSTGKADVDTDAFAINFAGFTAAANVTKVLSSVSLAELPTGTVGIRCRVGSTTYYLPLVVSTEWN